MITFHAVVYAHHRRADGTYPVKIKVTFKRVHRTLPTNLTARSADLTRTLHLKSPQLVQAADNLIDQMRQAVSSLTYFDLQGRDIDWIVGYIRKKLTANDFKLNFLEWCRPLMSNKVNVSAVRAWVRFAGENTDINDITARMLTDFVAFVDEGKAKKGTTAKAYLIQLGAMYRKAKERYNDEDNGIICIPKSPFERVKVKASPAEGQRNLGVELLQRIINEKGVDERTQLALDALVVSFALMGANLADLWEFREQDGWWNYQRAKTKDRRSDKAQMRVRIPECIRPRLERLNLHCYKRVDNATIALNKYLSRWASANGIEPFTFYAARHSWASIARGIGIEKATIDECLAHIGDYKIADIYAERNWDAINAANSRVLALFDW